MRPGRVLQDGVGPPGRGRPHGGGGPEQNRIVRAIEALAVTPRPPGAIQLAGGDGELRIRVGDYRIIYDIEDDALVVLVLRIGHRGDVYK